MIPKDGDESGASIASWRRFRGYAAWIGAALLFVAVVVDATRSTRSVGSYVLDLAVAVVGLVLIFWSLRKQ